MNLEQLNAKIESLFVQLHREENSQYPSPEILAALHTALDNLILERQRLSQAEAKRKKPLFDK